MLLSFVIAAVALRPASERAWQWDLPPMPRWLRAAAGSTLTALGVFLFLLVLIAGWFGEQDSSANIAPVLVWVLWWVGLLLLTALIGNLWPHLDPWSTIWRHARRWLGRPPPAPADESPAVGRLAGRGDVFHLRVARARQRPRRAAARPGTARPVVLRRRMVRDGALRRESLACRRRSFQPRLRSLRAFRAARPQHDGPTLAAPARRGTPGQPSAGTGRNCIRVAGAGDGDFRRPFGNTALELRGHLARAQPVDAPGPAVAGRLGYRHPDDSQDAGPANDRARVLCGFRDRLQVERAHRRGRQRPPGDARFRTLLPANRHRVSRRALSLLSAAGRPARDIARLRSVRVGLGSFRHAGPTDRYRRHQHEVRLVHRGGVHRHRPRHFGDAGPSSRRSACSRREGPQP